MIVKSLIKIAKTDPWILNHDHSSGGEIACVCPAETTPGDDLVEQDHDKVEDVGDDLDDGDIDDVAKQWWGFSTKKVTIGPSWSSRQSSRARPPGST